MIAVTFALPAESSEFIRLLQNGVRHGRGAEAITGGELHRHQVQVVHTGVGEKVSRQRLTTFLTDAKPQLLISSGFAGATSNDLKPGDVLLAENYCDAHLGDAAESALRGMTLHLGTLASAHCVIDGADERASFARASGANAIDMETASIAELCASLGVAMLSVRAISDTPAFPFPAPPGVLFNLEKQKTSAAALAFYLATHPAAITRLVRFASQVKVARKSLATALDLLLRDGVSPSPS